METPTDPIFAQVEICLQIGDKAAARALLKVFLQQHPRNAAGWLWLSKAVETRAETIFCLEQAARLQPENAELRSAVKRMTTRRQPPPAALVPGLLSTTPVSPAPQPQTAARQSALPQFSRKQALTSAGLVLLALLAVAILYFRTRPQPALTSIAAGGTYTYPDAVWVEVPPGALADGDRVKIIPAVPENWAAVPDFARFWEISTLQGNPKKPLTITFSYAGLANSHITDPSRVFVVHWNGEEWELVDGEVNLEQETVTIKTKSLSPFGVTVIPHIQKIVNGLHTMVHGVCEEDNEYIPVVEGIIRANALPIPGVIICKNESIPNAEADNSDPQQLKIQLNPEWLQGKVSSLPEADGELLIQAVFSHELSHMIQGSASNKDALTREDIITPEIVQAVEQSLVKEQIYPEGTIPFSLMREIQVFFNMTSAKNLTMEEINQKGKDIQHERKNIYESYREANFQEIVADRDGVRWAGTYNEQKKRTALLMIYSYYVPGGSPHSYIHPPDDVRAAVVAKEAGLGEEGGILGQVTLSDFETDLCGTTVQLDGQPALETDCEGRFFLGVVPGGEHTLTISKSGYQTNYLTLTVPSKNVLVLPRLDTELVKETDVHLPLNQPVPARLAFTGEDYNIYVYRIDSGEITAVTHAGDSQRWYGSAQFSPDGSRLAYCHNVSDSGLMALYVAGADGSDPRLLVENTTCQYDWTPDGKSLTVSQTDSQSTPAPGALLSPGGLWNVDVRTGEKSLLLGPISPYPLMLPVWSSTGKWLALNEITYIEGSGNLLLWSPQTGVQRDLFMGDMSRAGFVSFSPDEKQAAFNEATYVPQYGNGVYIADVSGQNRRKIFSRSDGGVGLVNWSPDGQRISFTFAYGDPFLSHNSLMVMNVDGSNVQAILQDLKGSYLWAADGQSLLINQEGDIYLYQLNTGAVKHLAHGDAYLGMDWYAPAGTLVEASAEAIGSDIETILRLAQADIQANSVRFLSNYGAEQVHYKPCCSNFALSNDQWQTKEDALQQISNTWGFIEPRNCRYMYKEDGAASGTTAAPFRFLIIMVGDQLSFTFTNESPTGSLLWTEYSSYPLDSMDTSHWEVCPEN